MLANITKLEELVLLYYLEPRRFQEELDYMYLDSIEDNEIFLKNIQEIFGGESPSDEPWVWVKLAQDERLPWKTKVAEIVVPVAEKLHLEDLRKDEKIDREIEEQNYLEAHDIKNFSDDQLEDMGMKRCKICRHILTFNGGDWYSCNEPRCSCSGCAERVV